MCLYIVTVLAQKVEISTWTCVSLRTAPRLLSGGSGVKNPAANEMKEVWVRSLGQEDSPGGGNGNLLQSSRLENSIDRGALWVTVHGVAKSRM